MWRQKSTPALIEDIELLTAESEVIDEMVEFGDGQVEGPEIHVTHFLAKVRRRPAPGLVVE